MGENIDKTKHDQEIKRKLNSIQLADRVGCGICLHCGEKPMLPNSGLCLECRQLPKYKELLDGGNFEMEPEDVLHYDGDLWINKPEANIEPERETHSWVWKWDLIEWVFQWRIHDSEIPKHTEGYQKMDDGKGGHFWRKQS